MLIILHLIKALKHISRVEKSFVDFWVSTHGCKPLPPPPCPPHSFPSPPSSTLPHTQTNPVIHMTLHTSAGAVQLNSAAFGLFCAADFAHTACDCYCCPPDNALGNAGRLSADSQHLCHESRWAESPLDLAMQDCCLRIMWTCPIQPFSSGRLLITMPSCINWTTRWILDLHQQILLSACQQWVCVQVQDRGIV